MHDRTVYGGWYEHSRDPTTTTLSRYHDMGGCSNSDLDFIVSRTQDPGWMMGIPGFFQGLYIPDWLIESLAILALGLVFYAIRVSKSEPQATETVDHPPKVSPVVETPDLSPLILLVELMGVAEKQGWRFTDDGSQQIFEFVHALRDAGSTKAILFWGREKQRIPKMTAQQALAEIDHKYWLKFKIDGISCLEISDLDAYLVWEVVA